MGHVVNHGVYDENVNKKSVQAEWDEIAMHEDWQEGCSGLPNDIRWINHTCNDYDEAREYLEKNDNGWYDQLAVKFLDYPELKKSKTLEMLEERAKRLCSRYVDLAYNKIHYANVKSQFISCRTCGSKLASSYIRTNKCPVCFNDLRPASTLDLINKAKNNYEKAEKDVELEMKKLQEKQKKKAKVKWLVKIEYHV